MQPRGHSVCTCSGRSVPKPIPDPLRHITDYHCSGWSRAGLYIHTVPKRASTTLIHSPTRPHRHTHTHTPPLNICTLRHSHPPSLASSSSHLASQNPTQPISTYLLGLTISSIYIHHTHNHTIDLDWHFCRLVCVS